MNTVENCCNIFCLVGGCKTKDAGGCICECRKADSQAKRKSMQDNPECWPEIKYNGKEVRGYVYIPPK